MPRKSSIQIRRCPVCSQVHNLPAESMRARVARVVRLVGIGHKLAALEESIAELLILQQGLQTDGPGVPTGPLQMGFAKLASAGRELGEQIAGVLDGNSTIAGGSDK